MAPFPLVLVVRMAVRAILAHRATVGPPRVAEAVLAVSKGIPEVPLARYYQWTMGHKGPASLGAADVDGPVATGVSIAATDDGTWCLLPTRKDWSWRSHHCPVGQHGVGCQSDHQDNHSSGARHWSAWVPASEGEMSKRWKMRKAFNVHGHAQCDGEVDGETRTSGKPRGVATVVGTSCFAV